MKRFEEEWRYSKHGNEYERRKALAKKEDQKNWAKQEAKRDITHYHYEPSPYKDMSFGQVLKKVGSDIVTGLTPNWLLGSSTQPGKIIAKPPATAATVSTYFQGVQLSGSEEDTPSTSSGFKHLGYTSWGKAIELDLEGKVGGIMYEQMLATSVRFKVNNSYAVKIEQFRSVVLPDKVNLDVTYNIQLACSDPNGSRMSAKDAAYLKIHYDQNGKLEKMTVPNTPKISNNPTWPVLTVYHGKVCSLPVSSGTYNWLVQKIQENHGDVVIGHTEDYHLDYLG